MTSTPKRKAGRVLDRRAIERAHALTAYARELSALIESSRDRAHMREAHEAWLVAADAWEEVGPYPYGVSPPHGIFTKGTTISYLKEMSRARGSPYFSRASSRFFGGDTFYGPYVGPGGVFFVQRNNAGITLKEVEDDWTIRTLGRVDAGLAGVREEAQARARAGRWGEKGRFPTWLERLQTELHAEEPA